MFRRRITAAITRRDLQFVAVGMALTLVAVTALDDDPADAVPVESPADGAGTTFVPFENCRLFDTRPEFNVGPRDTPLGPDEVHQQQVTGLVGDCDIPATATGVALNVTVVDPTAASFLTVFPYAPSPPDASNLNYLPGSPPTPNKVDVQLSATGQLGFYNLAGTVHVLADATGYYTSSTLQAIQDQLDALQGVQDELAALQADANGLRATVERLRKARTVAFSVASDGEKVGEGNYESTRTSTGVYEIVIDLRSFEIPQTGLDGRSISRVVSPRCAGTGGTASVTNTFLTIAQDGSGFMGEYEMRVAVANDAGAATNCPFDVIIAFSEPSSIRLGPLLPSP